MSKQSIQKDTLKTLDNKINRCYTTCIGLTNKRYTPMKNLIFLTVFFGLLFFISQQYDRYYCETNGADYYHACK